MNNRGLMNEWTIKNSNLNYSVFYLKKLFTTLSRKYSFCNVKMNVKGC